MVGCLIDQQTRYRHFLTVERLQYQQSLESLPHIQGREKNKNLSQSDCKNLFPCYTSREEVF